MEASWFRKLYYHTKFQDPTLIGVSIAPTLQVRTALSGKSPLLHVHDSANK
jgi:hypothetical protein